ncbi:MAG: ornithine cyclodeaminase family protein [Chloroflexi bacterium]|nr:ornithine cyclodeaminase family protein [Chloroflexota bacterium]MYC47539.1 ornithine cyclodeaminase family protein [Chloroflexota bacterium]
MPLYINESEVESVLDMDSVLDAVEGVQRRLATGEAENLPRRRILQSGRTLHLMAASDEGCGYAGHKSYLATAGGIAFSVLLYEIASGQLAAVIEANRLGQLRTGAASGVASRHLARPESSALGIVGGGFQARTQVEAICRTLPIRSVRAFRRDRERLEGFCGEISDRCGVAATAAESAEAAIDGADVIVTATNSADPVLDGYLENGVHVNAMGSNRANAAELGPLTVGGFDRVVCDDIAQARIESGDLLRANAAGTFSWGTAVALGDVIAGKARGRTGPGEKTLFESLGIAAWDIAAAAIVLERARDRGLGREL